MTNKFMRTFICTNDGVSKRVLSLDCLGTWFFMSRSWLMQSRHLYPLSWLCLKFPCLVSYVSVSPLCRDCISDLACWLSAYSMLKHWHFWLKVGIQLTRPVYSLAAYLGLLTVKRLFDLVVDAYGYSLYLDNCMYTLATSQFETFLNSILVSCQSGSSLVLPTCIAIVS